MCIRPLGEALVTTSNPLLYDIAEVTRRIGKLTLLTFPGLFTGLMFLYVP